MFTDFIPTSDLTLHLLREECGPHATLGKLFIDGSWKWYTLEDRLHDGPKIPGETCIPAGRYQILMTLSVRFGRIMPQVINVPGFTGVRIHGGNTDKDTKGCILVGGGCKVGAGRDPMIHDCAPALQDVYAVIDRTTTAGFKVWIEIVNPSMVPKSVGSAPMVVL